MNTQGIALNIFGRSVVGKGRTNDEDAFVVSDLANTAPVHSMTSAASLQVGPRGVLIAVSDGMGGAPAGDVASSMVVSELGRGMSTVEAGSAEVALQLSVEAVNRKVFTIARDTDRAGMGATLTAVLFHDIYAYTAEIGDSRAYLLRAGRLAQLTHDQSYIQRLIDSKTLTQKEAEASQYSNVILQAMGLNPNIDVGLNRVCVRRHDRFLVCSDGLWGAVEDQVILNLIRGGDTLEKTCDGLIEAAVKLGSDDDITVVLAEVEGEGAPLITEPERLSLETSEVFDPA